MSCFCVSKFRYSVFFTGLFCSLLTFLSTAEAQTDIRITGPEAGFPVAVAELCNAGEAADPAKKIPEIISKNLQISGLFKVLNPANFVETPGKCYSPEQIAYSDWTVIGAEGLVRGQVQVINGNVRAELYLHDVLQQKTVIGKRYEAQLQDFSRIAHRFSNEILLYFTGEKGIFGTQIAYVSQVGRFKDLFVMDLDGSNVRQLTRDKGLVFSPNWSPQGDRIVYTSYASRQPELYMTTPSGTGTQRLTKRPGLEVGAKFSPDGSKLAAGASFDGITKIVLFDLKGTLLRKLTGSSSIDVSPSWSPDGSQLAFCSNRGGGPQIYVMNADGSNIRRVSFAQSNYCTSPAWSPKGDKLAFVCRSAGFQIFMGSPDGGSAVQLTFAGDNEDPSWAPDGRFLAFSSNFGSGAKSIGILSLLGGRPTRITTTKSEDIQPAWSPRVDD